MDAEAVKKVRFKIYRSGEEIPLDDALAMQDFPEGYDPLGWYDKRSPYHVVNILRVLEEEGKIDRYEVLGELPPLDPIDEDVYY